MSNPNQNTKWSQNQILSNPQQITYLCSLGNTGGTTDNYIVDPNNFINTFVKGANLSLSGTTTHLNNTILNSGTTLNGTTTVNGLININNTLTSTGTTNLNGSINTNGVMTVNGNAIFNSGATFNNKPFTPGIKIHSPTNTGDTYTKEIKNNSTSLWIGKNIGYPTYLDVQNESANINNIFIGDNIANHSTYSSNNISLGNNSLQYINSNTSTDNISLGYNSLTVCNSSNNVGVGNYSLANYKYNQNDGDYGGNVGVGSASLGELTYGFSNTCVGDNSGRGCLGTLISPIIGNTLIGSPNVDVTNVGNYNTIVGYMNMFSSGTTNVFIGSLNTGSTANKNTTSSSIIGNGNLVTGDFIRVFGNNNQVTSNTLGSTATRNIIIGDGMSINAGNSSNGDIFIGGTNTGTSFNTTINGNVYANIVTTSDERDKADIKDTSLGLEFIKSLRAVDYKWDKREDYIDNNYPIKESYPSGATEEEISKIDSDYENNVSEWLSKNNLSTIQRDGSKKKSRYHHGFIAQDVKKIIEETGVDFGGLKDEKVKRGFDKLAISYEEFIAPMVKAIQELSIQNEKLNQRVSELESKK